jgi:uncharacterized cofD-like protein
MNKKRGEDKPRVVILGGGNGTSRLLVALAPLLEGGLIESLHALVHMTDDGGSTGRLREQYGVSAVGDLTNCLLALSKLRGDVRGDVFLKSLGYRFDRGDFEGHTLRNIFLAALEMNSDIDTAVATMARVLQIPKQAGVVPTTLAPLTQQVFIAFDGVQSLLGEGQHSISHNVNMQADPRWSPGDVRVKLGGRDMNMNPRARELLEGATHIVVAPGHTYGTILPALALPDVGKEISKSKATVCVVMTLLTTPRQTSDWRGEDFVRVYESYLGRGVEVVVANSSTVPIEMEEGQDWVEFIEDNHDYRLVKESLVSSERQEKKKSDVVPRAIAVHDSNKLKGVFEELLSSGRA